MKKIYVPFISFTVVVMLSFTLVMQSCKKSGSFLSATSTTNLTQTTVFADSVKTMGFLAGIYSNIGFAVDARRFGNGGMDIATDEAEPGSVTSSDGSGFALGTISAGTVSSTPYSTCYTQIRAVNELLANIQFTNMKPVNKTQVVAEARFLRAWYYSILLQHYGGVPLMGDTLLNYTTPINVKRATFDAVVKYIVSECDAVKPILPITQTGLTLGRASGGACLALKSRILLYAASPLYNGTTLPADAGPSSSGPVDPALVGYPTADPTRWSAARDAAQALFAAPYSLNTKEAGTAQAGKPGAGFQGVFTIRDPNPEYIWELMTGPGTTLENGFLPPSRNGGGGSFPYQGVVDAFPMNTGKAITDPTSLYDPNNPYANRDPRLDYTVLHDQSSLLIRNSSGQPNGLGTLNLYTGLNNDKAPDVIGTPTGYYRNKMLDPNVVSSSLVTASNRCIPLIRLAEVLLNYCEASNEVSGPSDLNIFTELFALRARAGIAAGSDGRYGIPLLPTQAQLRTIIQNERRIELAYEGFRFWDVRRWKIAPTTENVLAQGMHVAKSTVGTTTTTAYNVFNVRQHRFTTNMYLWPFSIAETGKSASLVQNPGY